MSPGLVSQTRMLLSCPPPDGGLGDAGAGSEAQQAKPTATQPSYIKEMESSKDWQDALENRVRPVLIQAGASWCGPCQTIKPMLIEAVTEKEGAIEYLYVDVDKHPKIAQTLRVSANGIIPLALINVTISFFVDLARSSCVSCQKWQPHRSV